MLYSTNAREKTDSPHYLSPKQTIENPDYPKFISIYWLNYHPKDKKF